MNDNISIRTCLCKEDIRTYVSVRFFNSFIFKIIAVFTVLHLLISISRYSQSGESSYLFSGIVFFILIALAMIVSIWLGYYAELRKSDQSGLLREEASYQFSQDGFRLVNKITSPLIKWSDLYKVVEYKRHYFIYLSPAIAIIIPKRHLSGEQIGSLITLMQGRVRKCQLYKHPGK